jgi:hypothetical protein
VGRRLHALSALRAGEGDLPPDRNRRHILVVLLERLAELPEYRGLDIEGTASVLHALTSFELYDQLASSDSATPPERRIHELVSMVLRQAAAPHLRAL